MTKEEKFNKSAAKARKSFHNIYLKIMNKVEPIEVEVVNPEMLDFLEKNYFSKGKPINFVANHTNSHDIPLAAKGIKEHFYVVIAKEGLTLIQKIGFFLNGPLYIERKNKESRKNTQKGIILAHKNGYSTLTYSEASWNTKENKFMNRLFNGAVNASKEDDTDIIPLTFEYLDGKCYMKIGMPFIVDKFEDSRKQSDELRDIMTTMRFEYLEQNTDFYPEKTILKQIEYLADNWDELPDSKMQELLSLYEKLNNLKSNLAKEFNDTIKGYWDECPGLNRNFEASCIYKDGDSPEEVFEHLNILEANPKAAFLFKPGIKGFRE